MAKLLALDWDQLEARIVVARPRGDGIVVDNAISVPLNLSAQQGDHSELAEQLSAALSQAGASKCQALTAVGRSLIELGTLQLPPAPADELPEMVRFQAMREFSSLHENSPLDFVPLGAAGRESGEVIAAAIPLNLSKQIEQALTSQGHEPHRTVMRPCAVASLAIRRRAELRTGVGLVIAQQADSAELVVVKNGQVVFTRSFRLPPDWVPGESGEPLLGEVRRTIAAAQNQLGQSRVERIVLIGTPVQHAELCQRLRDRTKLDVELLDPFDGISVNETLPHPERFAAAIGMLVDEANGTPPVIDFLNPRKAPEPESNTRKRVFYGSALAAVLLGIAALVMWQYSSLNKQIESRTRELAKVSNDNKNLESTVRLAKELRKWKQADRNWLDELSHLSNIEGLTADDFMLTQISGRTLPDDRGIIDIQGKSKDLSAQHKLQVGWVNEHHTVSPQISSPIKNNKDNRYPQMFRATIQTENSIPILGVRSAPPPDLGRNTPPKPAAPAEKTNAEPATEADPKEVDSTISTNQEPA